MPNDSSNASRRPLPNLPTGRNPPPEVRIRVDIIPPTRASIYINGREASISIPSNQGEASPSRPVGSYPESRRIDNPTGAQSTQDPGTTNVQPVAACTRDSPTGGRAADVSSSPPTGGRPARQPSHNPLPPPPRDPYRERLAAAGMDISNLLGSRFGPREPRQRSSTRSSGGADVAYAQSGSSQAGRSAANQGDRSPATDGQARVVRYCPFCGERQVHLSSCAALQDQPSRPGPARASRESHRVDPASPGRRRSGEEAQAGSSGSRRSSLPENAADSPRQRGRESRRTLDPHRPIDLDNNSSPPPPSRPRRQRDGSMSPVPMSPLRLNRPLLPNEQLVPTVRPDQMLPGDYVIPTPPATDSRESHISNSRNVQQSSAPARQSSDRDQQSSALVQQTSAAPAVPVDQWDPDTMSFVPRGTRRRLRPPSPPSPPPTRESHVSQPSRSTLPQQAQPYLPIYGYSPAAWSYPWAAPQQQPAASMSSESMPQSARQPRTFLPTPLYTSSGQAILPNEPGLNHPGRGFPPPSVGVSRYNYPTVHPMLMENPRKPYAPPPLQWDVRCPPYTAKYITPRAQVVPISPQQWDMPFTKEKVTEAQIHINHNMLELLRHTPHVHIQQSTPITVKDVLCAIYDWLQELVRPPERDRLKERYPQLWSMAEEAFRRRCLTCPHIAIPAAEWRKGMKRVDLLTDLVMWSGMYVVHTEDSRWFLRVSLLQPADVDPRWHFQGGSRVSH